MKNLIGHLPVLDGHVIPGNYHVNKGLATIKGNRIKKMRKVRAQEIEKKVRQQGLKALRALKYTCIFLLILMASYANSQSLESMVLDEDFYAVAIGETKTNTPDTISFLEFPPVSVIGKKRETILITGHKTKYKVKFASKEIPVYKLGHEYFFVQISKSGRLKKHIIELL